MRFPDKLSHRFPAFVFLLVFLILCAVPALADVLPAGHETADRGTRVTLTLPVGAEEAVWSSADNAVAVVDRRGRVSGRKAGETTITASLPDGRSYAYTFVVTQPVSRVRMPESRMTLERGQTSQLVPIVLPEDATNKALTYESSDESVARVSPEGLITAVRAGKATITAVSANGKKATVRVVVTQPVTEIAFPEAEVTIERGKRVKMPAAVAPEDATNKRVSYSVEDRAVAAVSSTGYITGRKAGTTYVVAKASNGLTARIRVTVTQPVTRVRMPASSMKLERGAAQILEPLVYPDDATIRTLTFSSSDESVARVDQNGRVTALKAGRANIIATAASGRSATLRLTVTQPVTGIAIESGAIVLNRGSSQRLGAVIEPGDATDKKVKWTSSDPSVARVSSSGSISGRAPGNAVITATSSNGLTATCAVTVVQPVTRVSLGSSRLKLSRNNTAALTAALSPANATDKTVVWASSNAAIASVDQNGLVKGLSDGNCVITATAASGKSAAIRVTVTSVKVTGVSLDRFYAGVDVGRQLQLSASILPDNATEKRVTYASSDPGVATVDQNGLVTAVKAGQAIITATASEGGFQAECRFTSRAPGQKRLQGVVIGINPGHQEKGDFTQDPIAPGATKTRNRIGVGTRGVSTRTPEYVVTLQVGLKLRDLLESEGATVVITRTANDVYVTNIQRAQMLNEAHAAIALQLHCDGSDNRSRHGISVWTRKTGVYNKESAEAAAIILDAMVARTGALNAGANRSDNYMSLNYSTIPAVLVEMGFMSNPAEDAKLCSDEYQQLLAEGIMDGLCAWLGR